MTGSRDDLHDDDVLVSLLGQALDEAEPVPGDAVAAAASAFDLGRVDAELAELVFDSLLDEAAVAMRHEGPSDARSLGFLAQGCRVDVELVDDDSVLLGQLDPPAAAEVQLQTSEGEHVGSADDLGRFRFTVARGSLRLQVTTAEGAVVRTPWITW
jgi:hypothetical protein